MWMGRPPLTSSVAKILRKSCGVNFSPRNPGWVWAGSSQRQLRPGGRLAGDPLGRRAEVGGEDEVLRGRNFFTNRWSTPLVCPEAELLIPAPVGRSGGTGERAWGGSACSGRVVL